MNSVASAAVAALLGLLATPALAAEKPGKPLPTIPVKVKTDKDQFPTKVETDGGSIGFETMDGRASFEIEGRFQFDTMFFDGIYNDALGGAWASDTKTRRMRLGVGGHMDHDWQWLFILDVNNDSGRTTLDTGQITYKGWSAADLNVGRFKRPFLMDALNSSKWLSLVERSLIYDVSRSHVSDFSVMLSQLYDVGESGKLSWYTAVVNEGAEDYGGGENAVGRDQYQFYARTAWAPWAGKTDVLHFGAAFGEMNPANNSVVDITTRLGVSSADAYTISYAVNDDWEGGAEALYILGPFSAQTEGVLRHLSLANGDSADVTGGYVLLTWTLTGESRAYKPYPARPDAVVPAEDSPYGAIELATRYDRIALERPGLDDASADLFSVGANWYINSHLHFKLNVLSADTENFGATETRGTAVTSRIAFQF